MDHAPDVHTSFPPRRDLPWWLYLPLPLLVYPAVVISAALPGLRPVYNQLTTKESGVEFLGVVVLVIGVVVGVVMLLRLRRRLPAKWLTVWFSLTVAAMFFLAGEELSWGQHLGFWGHEEAVAIMGEANDQQETNLHNISNVLDQNPTNLVVLGTFVAFVINPIYLKVRGERLRPDNPGYWFWPSMACLPAAIGVLLIRWPERFYELFAGDIPRDRVALWRHSEIHEAYIAMLMATYVASVAWRLSRRGGAELPAR